MFGGDKVGDEGHTAHTSPLIYVPTRFTTQTFLFTSKYVSEQYKDEASDDNLGSSRREH